MNTEMKEESKNSEFTTKDREMSASLDTDKLRRMGFHYPELALRVIEAVERGDDIETLEGRLIKSRIIGKINGHHVLTIALEDESDFFYMGEEMPASFKIDSMLFLDRKWVPTTNVNLLCKVIESLNGKSVEEALECLKEEETEEAVKPEENTQTSKAPNHEAKEEEDPDEEFAEKEEGEQPEANPDPTMEEVDLRNALSFCKDIFEEKLGLYGGSFCFMHPETVTDQLYMKATILKKRLTERDKGERFEYDFFEGVRDEFAAVVNYGVIALRQGGLGVQSLVPETPLKFYTDQMQAALSLICDKGDDYGELWREQRIGTFSDMIYTKVRRLKSIENQYRVGGMTKEDYHKFAGDQYRDLINYGLFGVARMSEILDILLLEMEDYESEEEE